MQDPYAYCEALVRERDRERFLSALFAPAAKRPHLFALYGFDLELAHVPDAVREPMAGEIRLQWWREALAGERAEEARANPVAAALLETIGKHALPNAALQAMIDARQFDLLGQPMASRAALNEYLDALWGGTVALAARLLDPGWHTDEPLRLAGRSLGIVRLLRSFARDVAKGRLYVPLDLLAAHDVHTASVLAGENTPGLRDALAELRGQARAALEQVRKLDLPQRVLPAFLPLAPAPLHLARMDKARDPFRSSMEVSRLRSQFALWRAARRGRV